MHKPLRPTLETPIEIGSMAIRNRLYRAPVLEGAGSAEDPAAVYRQHFGINARTGVGLIIQGNTIVTPEGRTSPGMSCVVDRASVYSLRSVPEIVHKHGARIVLQLGHGGTFALESWQAAAIAGRSTPPWAPSRLPWPLRWVHRHVFVPTTREVEQLVARFALVASWAREAGYDGVQLAASNAKLLHQFLSPYYNKRDDRYGGNLVNRFRILAEIRASIAEQAGSDFPVLLKFAGTEDGLVGPNYGVEVATRIARLAEDAGFAALTPAAANVLPNTAICRGEFPRNAHADQELRDALRAHAGTASRHAAVVAAMWVAARRYPFSEVWNRSLFSAVKRSVQIPVFAVGGIRRRSEADAILGRGEADMVGIGRPFYAEPRLSARLLGHRGDKDPACQSCNACIIPQMLGMAGVCYRLPSSTSAGGA